MKRVEEHEVFAAAVGVLLNQERLNSIAIYNGSGRGNYADCEEFLVGDMAHLDEELIRRFHITDALLEKWDLSGICFRLCLYVCGGRLIGGHIFKYKDMTTSSHFRPTGYAMSPTQQEIRIAHRVLKYLIEKTLKWWCLLDR